MSFSAPFLALQLLHADVTLGGTEVQFVIMLSLQFVIILSASLATFLAH